MEQVSRRDLIRAVTRAEELLTELKLNNERQPDPVRVCERAGIRVHMTQEVAEARSYVRTPRSSVWLPARSCTRARDFHFDLAHEIHHCVETARCDNAELAANVFAGALLLPAPFVRAEWDGHRDVRRLQKLWWNVPPTCVVLRIGELALANTWIYQRATLRYARAQRPLAAHEVDEALDTMREPRPQPGANKVRATRLPDGPHRLAFVSAA